VHRLLPAAPVSRAAQDRRLGRVGPACPLDLDIVRIAVPAALALVPFIAILATAFGKIAMVVTPIRKALDRSIISATGRVDGPPER
jgi:hypothetical protein